MCFMWPEQTVCMHVYFLCLVNALWRGDATCRYCFMKKILTPQSLNNKVLALVQINYNLNFSSFGHIFKDNLFIRI